MIEPQQMGGSTARDTSAPPPERTAWTRWALLGVLAAYGLLVWQMNFIVDDAYISFHFAKNLVDGAGFVFNPGVDGRVEGSSELLWVALLVGIEALGGDPSFWSRAVSIACGALLILRVERTLRIDLALSPTSTILGSVFVGTLPVFAAWATGGMSTMAFALVVFEFYRRLFVRPGGAVFLALLGLCGLLLRPESPPLLLGLAAGAWLLCRSPRESQQRRMALAAGLSLLVFIALLVVARLAYFGYPLPNTAYAKVGLTAHQFLAGGFYLGRFFAVFPGAAFALLACAVVIPRLWRGAQRSVLAGALLLLTIQVAFVASVGGDWMGMFRYALPSLAPLAVLFALAIEAPPHRAEGKIRPALGLAVCLMNLTPAFGLEPLQTLIDKALSRKRMSPSQLSKLRMEDYNTELWCDLGRDLKTVAPPNGSLVARGIGAVSYHSDLCIFDQHGLVDVEIAHSSTQRTKGAASHDLHVPVAYFEPRKPSYAYAGLHSAAELEAFNPLLIRRMFGHPGDVDTARHYRPRVYLVPWLEREENYLVLAERDYSAPVDETAWRGPLLQLAEPLELGSPPPAGK
jgi:hypothetical protein